MSKDKSKDQLDPFFSQRRIDLHRHPNRISFIKELFLKDSARAIHSQCQLQVQSWKGSSPTAYEYLVSLLKDYPTNGHGRHRLNKNMVLAYVFGKVKGTCLFCQKVNSTPHVTGDRWQRYCSLKCSKNCPIAKASFCSTMIGRYGKPYSSQVPELRAKAVSTWESKYGEGVTCPAKSKTVVKKMTKTVNENYGGFGLASTKVSSRIRDTMTTRYGVENPRLSSELDKKRLKTLRKHYGDIDNPFQSEIVKKKIVDYWRRENGGTNCMHSPEIFDKQKKSAYQTKSYTHPRLSSTIPYQGYENYALDFILDRLNIDVKSLNVSKKAMPKCKYLCPVRGDYHDYTPDIRFEHKGKKYIVEVKCPGTLGRDRWPSMFAINMAKFKSAEKMCRKQSIIFLLAVVEPGKRIVWIEEPSLYLR